MRSLHCIGRTLKARTRKLLICQFQCTSHSHIRSFNKENQFMLRTKLLDYSKNENKIDWKKIRESIIASEKHVTEVNVDASILGCISWDNIDAAKSYMKFLENEGFKVNCATVGKLMKLYYLCHKNAKLSSHDKMEIINKYNTTQKMHEVLDPTTCENMIYGLITTDEWETCLKLLDMIKLTNKPSASAYSIVITKAFQSEFTFQIGWTLLQEMIANDRLPTCEVFVEYFRTINQIPDSFKEHIEKMFNFIGERRIILSPSVVKELHKIFKERSDFCSAITKVSKNGKCLNCSYNLENVSITEKDFNMLSSSFLKEVLIRGDIFQKSTPVEVEQFKKVVEEKGPFDCIIDGLNVAFSCGAKKSSASCVNVLVSVVKHLIVQKKRLLVLGRKHMLKWPKQQMYFIYQNATTFFTENLTHDDPFLLYAALKSGPKTDFVSRDLMRSHAHLLNPNLKEVFKRWQQEHQYELITVKSNSNIVLKEPIKFNLSAHKVQNAWHIPCKNLKNDYVITPRDPFIALNSWLCVVEQKKEK